MTAAIDADRLRKLVRDVIREVVGETSSPAARRVERARIAADGDLAGFVADLQRRLSDPGFALRLRLGQHRFVLDGTARAEAPDRRERAAEEALQGVITESRLMTLAGNGTTIRLAPGAILTPLAQDRLRALGIKIEKAGRC